MARKKKSVADQTDAAVGTSSTKTPSPPAPSTTNNNQNNNQNNNKMNNQNNNQNKTTVPTDNTPASPSKTDQVLTATQKKNLKKKLKRQELKQQETVETNSTNTNSALQTLIQQNCKIWDADIKKVMQRIASADRQADADPDMQKYRLLLDQYQTILKDMQNFHTTEFMRAKKPISKTTNTEALENQIEQIEATLIKQQKDLQKVQNAIKSSNKTANDTLEWEAQSKVEESLRYLTHLREQLMLMNQMKELQVLGDKIKQYKDQYETIQARRLVKKEKSPQKEFGGKELQWRRRFTDLHIKLPNSCHFTVIPCTLSSLAANFLYDGDKNPSLALRKIERRFGVLIDKQSLSPQQLVVHIIGIHPEPVNQCFAFLIECVFPNDSDLSLSNVISLENVNIGALVGSGGSKIRTLESDSGLIICIDKTRLVAFGTEKDVAANMPKLQAAVLDCNSTGNKSGQPYVEASFPTSIVRALSQGGTSIRSKILGIENSHAVSVNLRVNKKDDDDTMTSITIRGNDKQSCNNALNALNTLTKNLGMKKIECDDTKAYRLLRGAPPNFFPILLDKELVCPLKTNGGVLLVGPTSVLDTVYADGIAALEHLTRITETIEIKAADLKYFSRTKRSEIELESGAICKPPSTNGDIVNLTFFGNANQVEKAKVLVEKYIADMGVEEQFNTSLEVVMVLTGDKALKLRQLENLCHVKILLDRSTHMISVRGKPEALKSFRNELQRIEKDIQNDTVHMTEVIDHLSASSIPMVIGRSGANIRRLQSECGLVWVHIDNKTNHVIIRGSQESISQAKVMIDTFLSTDNNKPEMKETRIKNNPRQPVRGRNPTKGGNNKKNEKQKQAEPWNMDESAFPSLDDGTTFKKPHMNEECNGISPILNNTNAATVMAFDEDSAN